MTVLPRTTSPYPAHPPSGKLTTTVAYNNSMHPCITFEDHHLASSLTLAQGFSDAPLQRPVSQGESRYLTPYKK
jgi:hypothetical protein